MGAPGRRDPGQALPAVLGRRRAAPRPGPAHVPAAWTSALDRFTRSVHRFHEQVRVLPDRQLRHQLADTDAQLAAALTAVRSQARAVTVRGLLRAGTLCAHAIESLAAAAAASRNRDADAAARHLDDVREAVSALVSELGMHE